MERQKSKLAKNKNIPDDVRTSGEGSIPLDLIPEILKDLPVKTLARFICVSKPWSSIIRNRDFVKSYLIKSSTTHPQGLIFTFKSKRHGKHFFFSSSQRQEGDQSSISCVARYHMTCHSQPYTVITPSVHGLICYGPPSKLMVYNPSTRRSIALPNVDAHRIRMYHYLGYDPIGGDYKMLCMSRGMHLRRGRGLAHKIQVLTLGNGSSWRMIENCPRHSPESPHICIDGVLYYGGYLDTSTRLLRKDHVVMSFDVRSEKFDIIKVPTERATRFTRMTRYNGKLAIMFTGYGGFGCGYSGYIELWVLEDAATHE
ncbi:putative F-box protein [Raphanus sativus]|nr:putative F-box protein [Raphanus sativus]